MFSRNCLNYELLPLEKLFYHFNLQFRCNITLQNVFIFQVCHAMIVDSHFYKGCSSKLTCEEMCEHTDGPCYCCHGYQCNKYQPRGNNYTMLLIRNSFISLCRYVLPDWFVLCLHTSYKV